MVEKQQHNKKADYCGERSGGCQSAAYSGGTQCSLLLLYEVFSFLHFFILAVFDDVKNNSCGVDLPYVSFSTTYSKNKVRVFTKRNTVTLTTQLRNEQVTHQVTTAQMHLWRFCNPRLVNTKQVYANECAE